jgi:hypothetical protein
MGGEMADGKALEKLRAYLSELPPASRALLLNSLERGELAGDLVPGGDIILAELRRDLREAGRKASANEEMDRIGTPARLFFKPIEPYLVDDTPDRAHRGRVPRVVLEPIWQWIVRDLMPGEAKAYGDQITRLLLTNDKTTSERLARAFQDQACQRMRDALAATQEDMKARQRLIAQVGTPRALDDLREITGILRARDALAVFASRLPGSIRNLVDEQLDNVKSLLDSPVGGHPDVFVYALILVMSRLTVPWQLVRLAIKAAESDAAAKVAGSNYAVAVGIVLAEIDRLVAALHDHVRRGQFSLVGELIKDIHDGVRLLRTEMDLSGNSPWARQLAAVRSEVSKLIKAEIETVPGRMRRLLRPRPASEMRGGASLDQGEVEETEALIEFVGICRNYASELAINEVTLRVHSELQNYIETSTAPLLDSLRGSEEAHRPFRLSQVEAAVRFSGKLFGASYATLLSKAADVAAQGGERKAAAKA